MNRFGHHCILLITWLVLSTNSDLRAEFRFAHVFSDHMILQRESHVLVWGIADPHAPISVEFAGQKVSTMSDEMGHWQLRLRPLRASAVARDLRGQSGGQSISVSDVLVGEVWLASGQSNMAYSVGAMLGSLPELAGSFVPASPLPIRFLRLNDGPSEQPLPDLPTPTSWVVADSGSVRGFSAVAYGFALRLHESLNLPIGIIDTSRGGTPIEPFIPRSAYHAHPTLKRELELGDQEDLDGLWRLAGGVRARDANWLPSRLFHSRLAPVSQFSVRGAIWYQGESNCGQQEDPRDYQHKMSALISGWREAFGRPEMPFYFVQLPHGGAGAGWPYLREQQRLAADLPNCGMAVTIDLDGNDIHPANKADVSARLASLALAHDYGRDVASQSPMYLAHEFGKDSVTVRFSGAESGLMVADKTGLQPVAETPAEALRGFEVLDEQGTWHSAQARIEGQTVVVSTANAPQPAAVRYAYAPRPIQANLFNRDGLPAAPFCSDLALVPYDPQLPR